MLYKVSTQGRITGNNISTDPAINVNAKPVPKDASTPMQGIVSKPIPTEKPANETDNELPTVLNTLMIHCVVQITRLTEKELSEYHSDPKKNTDSSSDNTNIGGYSMRKRKSLLPRHDRDAKYNIHYTASTDDTSDEDYGRHKPVKHKFIAALSGPSVGRIAAQMQISQRTQKECSAAEAMLTLGSDNNPPVKTESENCNMSLSSEDNADSTSNGDSTDSVKPGSSSSSKNESVTPIASDEQSKDRNKTGNAVSANT